MQIAACPNACNEGAIAFLGEKDFFPFVCEALCSNSEHGSSTSYIQSETLLLIFLRGRQGSEGESMTWLTMMNATLIACTLGRCPASTGRRVGRQMPWQTHYTGRTVEHGTGLYEKAYNPGLHISPDQRGVQVAAYGNCKLYAAAVTAVIQTELPLTLVLLHHAVPLLH